MDGKIILGDALTELKKLPDARVDMCITSPPYWGLRDYGIEGQLGLEPTFQEYIDKLCTIFDEVKRVLKPEGTCWVNLGDTYGSGKGEEGDKKKIHSLEHKKKVKGYEKCLLQIPSRFSIEMCNRGWILRNTIIWYKPNCMPSSVKDRFTVDFEYLFFFAKQKKYYFEQQFEQYTEPMNRWGGDKLKADGKSTWDEGTGQDSYRDRDMRPNKEGRNKRCVWKIPTKPYKEAHFAVYPEELITTPIKAGCPEGGIVLDPFIGSGTTGRVATSLKRNYLGIDIQDNYRCLQGKRTSNVQIELL